MFHCTLESITKYSPVYNLCRRILYTGISNTAHMRYICAPNPLKVSKAALEGQTTSTQHTQDLPTLRSIEDLPPQYTQWPSQPKCTHLTRTNFVTNAPPTRSLNQFLSPTRLSTNPTHLSS